MTKEQLERIEDAATGRVRGWWAGATWPRRILMTVLLLALVALLLGWAFDWLTDWSDARRLQKHAEEVQRLNAVIATKEKEAQAAKAALAVEEAKVTQLTQRAEVAEANLQAAIEATGRARVVYQQTRSAGVDHTKAAPADSDLCNKLAQLGKPCVQ